MARRSTEPPHRRHPRVTEILVAAVSPGPNPGSVTSVRREAPVIVLNVGLFLGGLAKPWPRRVLGKLSPVKT